MAVHPSMGKGRFGETDCEVSGLCGAAVWLYILYIEQCDIAVDSFVGN